MNNHSVKTNKNNTQTIAVRHHKGRKEKEKIDLRGDGSYNSSIKTNKRFHLISSLELKKDPKWKLFKATKVQASFFQLRLKPKMIAQEQTKQAKHVDLHL